VRHAWPGNVRELRNLLEQVVLLGRGEPIDQASLGLRPAALAPGAGQAAEPGARTLAELERVALEQALQQCGWNVSRAARHLGVSRDTLRYRIDKHALSAAMPADFRDSR
jgi:two-component system, NtrC family, response regulator AtoC